MAMGMDRPVDGRNVAAIETSPGLRDGVSVRGSPIDRFGTVSLHIYRGTTADQT